MSASEIEHICAAAGLDKRVARLTGVHPVTAARWRRGEAGMPAAALLRLARGCARARGKLLHALGLDDDAVAARLATIETELAALRLRRPVPPTEASTHVLASGQRAGLDHAAPGLAVRLADHPPGRLRDARPAPRPGAGKAGLT